jgi:hypothetical protein
MAMAVMDMVDMATGTDMVTTGMDTDTTAMAMGITGTTTTGTTIIGIGIIGTATAVGGMVAGMAMVSVRAGGGPPMATFGFAIEGEHCVLLAPA